MSETDEPVEQTRLAYFDFAAKSLIRFFGLTYVAKLLGEDKSRLAHCLDGEKTCGVRLARRTCDLHYILVLALEVMHSDEVGPWLTESEPLLNGSIPINVLMLSGPVRVLQSLESRAAGAFA